MRQKFLANMGVLLPIANHINERDCMRDFEWRTRCELAMSRLPDNIGLGTWEVAALNCEISYRDEFPLEPEKAGELYIQALERDYL